PVPAGEDDSSVIGVPHPTPDVNPWVPSHHPPPPALRPRIARENALVLCFGHTIGMPGADVDRLAARPIAELSPVRLFAVPPPDRFPPKYQSLVHSESGRREEEPLALTNKGRVLAAVPGLCLESFAGLGNQNLDGLESFLSLTDSAHWGSFRNTGD